jgi:aminopeptidase N
LFFNNKMRLPLRVYSVEAQEDFLLDHTGKQFTAILTPGLPPLTLSIDPDFTVWRALAPEEAPPILRKAVVSKRLAMLVLNDKLATAALSFTKEFAEGEVEKVSKQQAMKEKFVIVFGKAQELDTWLARSKLPPRPTLVSEGDTQVWMINHPTKHVLVVSVPDQDDKAQFSLETVGKRLPHLARYAWVIFENGQTKRRGTWPVESPHTLIKEKSG